ncbi:SET methyltransferase domain containing protein [Nitzschia inconspicua]|uniref:SET methyltransferase domain containing protein n=1 Tax=Nitzschia inconspicua TaxID=303405 RepID=A0A9K3Q463_9STRA|nr:SET methyltransferase domain containing protein [Nitzschia inconspicua]
MASSTIPGAGWGVFAGRTYLAGDVIGPSSVAIPVVDLPSDRHLYTSSNVYGSLPEFLWEPANIGAFGEAHNVKLFLPGIMSLVNHHPTLDNVIPSGLLRREQSENSLATSPYYGFHLIATRTIQPNEELFLDYHGAFQTAKHPYLPSPILFPEVYGNPISRNDPPSEYNENSAKGLPFAEDYQQADNIVNALWILHEKLQNGDRNNQDVSHSTNQNRQASVRFTSAQWIDLLYRIRNQELLFHPRAGFIANLLPRTFPELQLAKELGVAKFHLRSHPMSPYRFCLDGIREGEENNEGLTTAVANKSFKKGQVVSISPLVYIPDGTHAMLMDTKKQNATVQLLQNYCFGHRQANLLLCPTTHAALIGHDREKANVRIQWPLDPYKDDSTAAILASPLQQFINGTLKSLLVEYVSLSDISEGDELYMDFGGDYESALANNKYKRQNRKAPPKVLPPNSIVLSSDPAMHPFYSHECNVYPNLKIDPGEEYRSWEDFHSNRMSNRQNWPLQYEQLYGDNHFASWYPCDVVNTNTANGLCDVVVYSKGYPKRAQWDRTIIRRLKNCPKDRIRVVHSPYFSHIHDSNAFRHHIPFPDDLFPLHWRADYKCSSYWNIGVIAESSKTFDYEQSLREVSCGLYIAKSNIPNAGFGLYTSIDIPAADIVIGSSLPAIVVHEPLGRFSWNERWVGKDYVWNGETFEFSHDGYPDFAVMVVNGLFGALANFHTGLVNMVLQGERMHPTLDRRFDPGAGAFSDMAVSTFKSLHPVLAGEELFVSYGENWLSGRPAFKDVPLWANFKEVDRIASSLWSMLQIEGAAIDQRAVPILLASIQNDLVTSHRTKMAMTNVANIEQLDLLVMRNGTAKMTVEARSQVWLMEHGFCLDNFYVKESTILQAGKGAFARRLLKSGSVIHSSPVITTPRSFLDGLDNYTKQAHINSKQLMTNYHFGHPNSTILFLPLTQMIAVNHNSDRMKSGTASNARVEFSKRDAKTRYLLQRPIEDVFGEKYSSIFLDVVATKDIEPDEEIFIDYGESWENAWKNHVKNWSSPCKESADDCFESSRLVSLSMNENRHDILYHRWSDVHLTACRSDTVHPWESGGKVVYLTNSTDGGVNEYLGFSYEDDGFAYPYLATSLSNPSPCKILQSNPQSDTFDVVYFFSQSQVPFQYRKVNTRTIVHFDGLPSADLVFVNKPLKADLHHPHAFRHEIHIPDSVFPSLWKNKGG